MDSNIPTIKGMVKFTNATAYVRSAGVSTLVFSFHGVDFATTYFRAGTESAETITAIARNASNIIGDFDTYSQAADYCRQQGFFVGDHVSEDDF